MVSSEVIKSVWQWLNAPMWELYIKIVCVGNTAAFAVAAKMCTIHLSF